MSSKGKPQQKQSNAEEGEQNKKQIENVQNVPQEDKQPSKNNLKDIASTRQYLESTVVNAVMQGMAEISKERPDNPLEYLGNFLIRKSKELEK